MNGAYPRETVGFYLKMWWQERPAARKQWARGALALLAVVWLAGAVHAPTTVDGIARLDGIWRWLSALSIGGFSFLWRLLEATGAIQETLQRPSLLWILLAATLPACLFGLYALFKLPVSEAYALQRRLQQLARSQGRLEPGEAAEKFAIEQGLPLVTVPNRKGRPVMIGLDFRDSEGHALVIAPTQTGKGLHLTETLLHWPGPALVVDPKQEQLERTAAARSRLGPIFSVPGHRLHLAGYYGHLRDYDEVAELHYHLLRPWASGERIFADKSLPLFLAAGDFAAAAHYNPLRLLLEMAESNLVEALTALRALPAARRRVETFTNGTPVASCYEDRFVTSAWGHFTTQLFPYQKHVETIAPAGNDNVISPDWVRQNATIYITYDMSELDAVNGVIAAMVAALLRYQIRRRRKERLLVAIDELPAVGLRNLIKYQPTCAGYGITMLLYAQTVTQLDSLYGEDDRRTLISNCRHQLWYPSGDMKTAQEMSARYGVTLKEAPARTVSTGDRQAGSGGSRSSTRSSSDSVSWREGPALLPTEMQALPDEQVLAVTHSDRSYLFLGRRLNPIPCFPHLPSPAGLRLPRAVYGDRRYPDWAALAARVQGRSNAPGSPAPAANRDDETPVEAAGPEPPPEERTPPGEDPLDDMTQLLK